MPVNQTFNGVVYPIPVEGDLRWGPPLTRYLVALGTGAISPSGGSYPLTADLNFGSSFGLVAAYYKSSGTPIATAGRLRLTNTDLIEWLKFGGVGNNTLGTDVSDNLVYNGGIIPVGLNTLADGKIWIGSAANMPVAQTLIGDVTTTNTGVTSITADTIVNADINSAAAIAYSKLSLSGTILNSDISVTAAIDYSKLALANSIINNDINASAAIAYSKLNLSNSLVNADINTLAAIDATKIANGTVSSTEFQYLDGVTSGIQAQIDGKQATGNYLTDLTGDVTATGPGSVAATLATVNSNVGSFTSANITVNAKGLVTAAANGGGGGTVTSVTGTANQIDSTTSSPNPVLSISSTFVFPGTLTLGGNEAAAGFKLTGLGAGTTAGDSLRYEQVFNTSTITLLGNIAFSPTTKGIAGTTTNDSADTGVVGEIIESTSSADSDFAATNTWSDFTSISLIAGQYDVTTCFNTRIAAATSVTQINIGFSTTSGNTSPGTSGINFTALFGPTAASNNGGTFVGHIQLASTTTVYLKVMANYTGSAPKVNAGRITAIRRR